MHAIAICGSPRKEGNTEVLLNECLTTLKARGITVELIRLSGKEVKPCTACTTCFQKKDLKCAIKNDDFHPIFAKMLAADIIIVGSPVYFGSATPNIMALLDRAGFINRACGSPLSRKIGGPVVVARRAGQNFTYAQLLFWFMLAEMVVPGSTYWNVAFGLKPGEVSGDKEGMETMRRFGENLAWLAERLCDGKNAVAREP